MYISQTYREVTSGKNNHIYTSYNNSNRKKLNTDQSKYRINQ